MQCFSCKTVLTHQVRIISLLLFPLGRRGFWGGFRFYGIYAFGRAIYLLHIIFFKNLVEYHHYLLLKTYNHHKSYQESFFFCLALSTIFRYASTDNKGCLLFEKRLSINAACCELQTLLGTFFTQAAY